MLRRFIARRSPALDVALYAGLVGLLLPALAGLLALLPVTVGRAFWLVLTAGGSNAVAASTVRSVTQSPTFRVAIVALSFFLAPLG